MDNISEKNLNLKMVKHLYTIIYKLYIIIIIIHIKNFKIMFNLFEINIFILEALFFLIIFRGEARVTALVVLITIPPIHRHS